MNTKGAPNISQWSADHGYKADTDNQSYPLRISNALPDGGLKLGLVQLRNNLKLKCDEVKTAFRIFLHMPGETPALSRLPFEIYPNEDTKISIKPTLITTTDGLRRYAPDRRQCFFNFERRLSFYRIYTQRNCEQECFAKFMKVKCGCAHSYMTSTTTTD